MICLYIRVGRERGVDSLPITEQRGWVGGETQKRFLFITIKKIKVIPKLLKSV